MAEDEKIDFDELIENYKGLMFVHKCITITAVVMLAAMIGMVIWGVLFESLRWLLIGVGVVIGIGGVALYLSINNMYVKTGNSFIDFFRRSGMSDDKISEFITEKGITLPGFKKEPNSEKEKGRSK